MVATRNIHPGEEVVNDYGPLSNSELLRAYGFVERLPLPPAAADGSIRGGLENRFREASVPGNCHSHVQIPLDIVVKACCKEPGQEEEKEEVGTRCRFLRRHKICPRDGVFKVYHNDFQSCWTAVPDEGSRFYALTECIRILLLPRDSFESFHSYIDGWRVPMAIPLSTSSTSSNGMTLSGTSILQAYERIVEAMSQRYPSTLDKDLSLLTSGGISTLDARKQSSIMARVDERAVLALLGVWAQSDSRDQVEGHCQKAWASSSRLALKRKAEDCDSDESEEGDLDGDEGEGKEKEEELGAEREVERIEKAMAPFSFNFII